MQRVTLLIDAHLDVLIDSLIKLQPSIRGLSGHWLSTLIRHAVTLSVAPTWVQSLAPLLTAIRALFTLLANPFPPSLST